MTTESQSVQPPAKAQSAAERMRAYRRRRRYGLRCVEVHVGRAEITDILEAQESPRPPIDRPRPIIKIAEK